MSVCLYLFNVLYVRVWLLIYVCTVCVCMYTHQPFGSCQRSTRSILNSRDSSKWCSTEPVLLRQKNQSHAAAASAAAATIQDSHAIGGAQSPCKVTRNRHTRSTFLSLSPSLSLFCLCLCRCLSLSMSPSLQVTRKCMRTETGATTHTTWLVCAGPAVFASLGSEVRLLYGYGVIL